MSEITYYWDVGGSGWTDYEKMWDGILANYATTSITGTYQRGDQTTCPGDDLGTITKVELRCYGHGDGGDRIHLSFHATEPTTPEYQLTMPASEDWSSYADVTADTNVDGWTWAKVADLLGEISKGLIVQYVKDAKANTMYCSKVEIRVTYDPAGGQSVTPSAVAAPSSIQSPSVAGSGVATITATPVQTPSSVQEPTSVLGSGSVAIAPTPVQTPSAVQAPAVAKTNQYAKPSAVGATSSIQDPSIAGSGVASITPNPSQVVSSIQNPAVVGSGAAPVSPSPVQAPSVVQAPTVSMVAYILLSAVQAPSAVQSPGLSGSGSAPISPDPVTPSGKIGGLLGYKYRQQITINATAAGAQTNYQMKLTVHKGAGASSGSDVYLKGHAESWTGTVPNDIRFTKADGKTPLDYWIESSDASAAVVWIEFDSIPASGTINFYIYYGKVGDSSASDGGRTFAFFDNFEKETLDVEFPAGRETPGAFWDVVNNKIYLVGGEDSGGNPKTTIYSFNIQTYAIATEGETLATAVGFISDAVVFDSVSRKAYIYGGKDSGTPTTTNKIQEYDVDGDSVVNLGITLPAGVGGVSAVLTKDGDVYIFGGLDYGTNKTVNTISKHDISEGTIETITETLPQTMAFMAAAYDSVNNKIYLYGGLTRNGGTACLDTIFEFDVASETIATLPETLPQVRDSSSAVYRDGYGYIIAGMDCDTSTYYNTIIRHDIVAGSLSTEDDTLEKREDDFVAVFDSVSDQGWLLPMLPNYATDNDVAKQRYVERFSFNGLKVETTWESKWLTDGGTPSIVGSELILSDAGVREHIHSPWVFGTDKVLRARMREVSYAVSGLGGGVNPTDDFGGTAQYAEAYWYPDGVTGVVANRVSASESTTDLSFPSGYANFDIIRNGSTSVIFKRNDGVLATHTVQVPTDNFYIKLTCRAGGEIRYDWILARKYASPEPTWGSWGSEEIPYVSCTVQSPVLAGSGVAPVSPSAVISPSAVQSPALAGSGAALITPSPAQAISAIQAPVVQLGAGDQSIDCPPVSATSSVQSPSVAGSGSAPVSPSPVATPSSIQSPKMGRHITGGQVAATSSIQSPALAGSGVAPITPSPVSASSSIQPPAASSGAIVIYLPSVAVRAYVVFPRMWPLPPQVVREVLFDLEGRPIQRILGWTLEKANEFDKAITANTNILASAIKASYPPIVFRVQVCVDNVGFFSAMITKGGSTQKVDLNRGVSLLANCFYVFDMLVHAGDTINFRHSTSATLQVLRIKETGGVI